MSKKRKSRKIVNKRKRTAVTEESCKKIYKLWYENIYNQTEGLNNGANRYSAIAELVPHSESVVLRTVKAIHELCEKYNVEPGYKFDDEELLLAYKKQSKKDHDQPLDGEIRNAYDFKDNTEEIDIKITKDNKNIHEKLSNNKYKTRYIVKDQTGIIIPMIDAIRVSNYWADIAFEWADADPWSPMKQRIDYIDKFFNKYIIFDRLGDIIPSYISIEDQIKENTQYEIYAVEIGKIKGED